LPEAASRSLQEPTQCGAEQIVIAIRKGWTGSGAIYSGSRLVELGDIVFLVEWPME
jgi:hypothetical protein